MINQISEKKYSHECGKLFEKLNIKMIETVLRKKIQMLGSVKHKYVRFNYSYVLS